MADTTTPTVQTTAAPVATAAPYTAEYEAGLANQAANATNATTAVNEPSLGQSLYDLAGSILSSNTGKGAAMGGLLGYLLNQYGSPGGVNLGVDMSKVSNIAPRTTTLPRSKYVSYADYGAQNQAPAMTSQMVRDFGISGGLSSRLPVSSYSAVPVRQGLAPLSFTSAGTGTGKLLNPTVTPRSNNTLSPLTGALMGSAIGYLMPSSTGTSSGTGGTGSGTGGTGGASGGSGGSGGNLWTNVLNAAIKKFGSETSTPSQGGNVGPAVPTGSGGEAYWTDNSGKQWAINPDGTTRLVWDPATGQGSAGGYDPEQFGDAFYNQQPADKPNNTWAGQEGQSSFPLNTGDMSTGPIEYSDAPAVVETYPTGNLTDTSTSYNLNQPMSNGIYDIPLNKDGGRIMATPLMADGGQVPHYYTYGTAIDPKQIMQNMAQGGRPQAQGGLHVPTVAGRNDYRAGSRVTGQGDGQSDDIPAMLADGEYVFDADTVAQLGNGSTKAGSDLLDRFREEIRAHKRSAPINKIPPPAKSPLAYLKAARSKKNG